MSSSVGHGVSVVMVVALAMAGCVGAGASDDVRQESSPSGEQAEVDPGWNHTVEIVGWDTRWRPGEVTITVHVNGTVTDGGDPVAYPRVVGTVNVTSNYPWWCFGTCPQRSVDQWGVYDVSGSSDGTFSAEVEAQFDARYDPPVVEPYCRGGSIWAWGKAGSWQNQSVPDDTDRVRPAGFCTQSYP